MRTCFVLMLFLTGLTAALVPNSASKQTTLVEAKWVKASALRPGDTVQFVAPAGPPEQGRVQKCADLPFVKQGIILENAR